MPFAEDDFDTWRRRRSRPGAVLADGSTSVLAENDLLGSTVDPDEFESWRAGERAADEGRQRYLEASRRPSVWDAPDPERGVVGNAIDYLTQRSLLPGARFTPIETPEDASGLRRGLDTAANIVGGVFDSATTPAGAATFVSGYGLGKGAVNGGGKILGPVIRGAERTGSAAYAGAGVERMLDAESFGDLGTGAIEALLGYIGARTPGPRAAGGGAIDDAATAPRQLGPADPAADPDYFTRVGGTARELDDAVDAAPWGSWGRTRQIDRTAIGDIIDADPPIVPPGELRGGATRALPGAGDTSSALYPAPLPPHGPIPLDPPARAIDRPDLLTDTALLAEVDRAMQGGNVDQFRAFLGELEARGQRGALSSDPLMAPRPPEGPTVGAPAPAAPHGGASRGVAGRP
jgi:hypothetical protein